MLIQLLAVKNTGDETYASAWDYTEEQALWKKHPWPIRAVEESKKKSSDYFSKSWCDKYCDHAIFLDIENSDKKGRIHVRHD